MDEDGPMLGVGFAIDFHDSFGQLKSLDELIGVTQARAVREFQKIEAASKGSLDLGAAKAQVTAFGNAATREMATASREIARVEKSGEALVRQLERQNAAFGKTREELRMMKAEAAAVSAEQGGLTELAARIRSTESEIAGKELAAARRARFAAEELAETKAAQEAAAAQKAALDRVQAERALNSQLAERARIEAAIGRNTGVGRDRATDTGATFSALAARAAEEEARSIRDATAAYQAFEAKVREGAAAMRDRDAAIASASGYAAKLEAEANAIGKTTAQLREMETAQRAAAAAAAGMPDQAERIRAAGAALSQAQGRAAALTEEQQRLAAQTKAATDAENAYAKSIEQLRQQADPAKTAQAQLNAQMALAEKAFREGRLEADEYGRIIHGLQTRMSLLNTAGFGGLAANGQLAGHHLLNLGFQAQDLGIQLLAAANSGDVLKMAFMALAQQGSQIYGIMQQSGLGARAFSTQVLVAARIIKVSGDAALIGSAQQAAANQAVIGSLAERALANEATAIAEVALAQTTLANAATAIEAAAAQTVLTAAEERAAAMALAATTAQTALAGAQARTAAAATAARAATVTSLGTVGAIAASIAVPLAVAGVALKLVNDAANQGEPVKAYAASLGLTAKELRNLDDVTVTYGDTVKAVFQLAGEALWSGIGGSVTSVWDEMKAWLAWAEQDTATYFNLLISRGVRAYEAIRTTWKLFPSAFSDVFYSAVNSAIDAMNDLIRRSVTGLNSFITSANAVLAKVGINLPTISAAQIQRVKNDAAGAAAQVAKALDPNRIMSDKINRDYVGDGGKAVRDRSRKLADARVRADALSKGYLDPDKAKTDKHAEQLARENEAIEAQIRNLYALTDAYGVSGAAALVAEARVKAESDAIKKRGDIEVFVNRQVRLAIAERIKDAAKATAGLKEQADAQARANLMVAAGMSIYEVDDSIKDQLADLPLLAAAQAAQQRGLAMEAEKATGALAAQRAERERLRAEEEKTQFAKDAAGGANRLAELREEFRLIGATDAARVHSLAVLKATQEAQEKFRDPANQQAYIAQQVQIADEAQRLQVAQESYNSTLTFTADKWDIIAGKVQTAGQGMADAFGSAGRAIGDMASIYANYQASRTRAEQEHQAAITKAGGDENLLAQERTRWALRSSGAQIAAFGDMTDAAKGFFKEHSAGYKAMEAAEKVFRAIQLAMSLQAMIQSALETTTRVTGAAAQAAAEGTAGIAAQSKLPFPLNIAAMAATAAALVAAGVSVIGSLGGGKNTLPRANDGTGTVLGDATAKSESIKRSIDALKEVDIVMLTYSRQMAASLQSIDSQIGGFASLVLRTGNVNADAGITEGFNSSLSGGMGKAYTAMVGFALGGPVGAAIGAFASKIPILGDILNGIGGVVKSLFGTKTKIVGGGLYGDSQSLGDILAGGYDASYYSDVQKKKKFFGLTTSTKYSTKYAEADPGLENQFTLILRGFNDAITAAAGPLGVSTDQIRQKLSGFVVDIGKIDLKGLTGDEIEEKLSAVFGAAADKMASAAFPGIERFQKVGEGLFETLVRVSSTVESVTSTMGLLGSSAAAMSMDVKMALAGQFESVSDFTGAASAYFETYYSKQEQVAARTAQFGQVFASLGYAMPSTLSAFRGLVEAQDLTTAAGQATYATLLQLAPAFADLQSAMTGAKSAADILSEQQDLQRRILELQGNTAALRSLDLAKVDVSNRALQEQVWALEDAKDAADAANQLRQAWASVGDGIMDEVRRIRGLTDGSSSGSFAMLQGQFNAMTAAARGGDQDAAGKLVGLSQSLLTVAGNTATSRQELERIKAQTAASLEATYGIIGAITGAANPSSTIANLAAAATSAQASNAAATPAGDLVAEVRNLRAEIVQLRSENNSGHAATAGNTGRVAKTLDDVTASSGGNAVSIAGAAA